ncbi:hypothetical protein BH23PLA1_BH23PLA1_29210 [soil metagenome]
MAGEKFTKYGATRADLEAAWQDRLSDANALYAANRSAAAIASGLYALEIFLKARICKKLDLESLPRPFEIHDLDGLLVLSGLHRRMNSKPNRKTSVFRHWSNLLTWAQQLNELRYSPDTRYSRAQARIFLDHLSDPKDGVLTWLSKQR